MHDRPLTAPSAGYDWSRFGRHRLRVPAGVLIDSPLGQAGHGWLATLWPGGDESGWSRMLWPPDANLGGWVVPGRLAGGDVIEFGADRRERPMRWYGILDSYDAVEWLVIQGPYPEPWAAQEHAQQLIGQLRYAPPVRARSQQRHCARRAAARP